jgi:hypothetical protein
MQRLAERRLGGDQLLDEQGVGAVVRESAEARCARVEAVDVEGTRGALPVGKPRQRRCLVDGVLGHVAIGRPLAARERQQARGVDVDRVVA